MTTLAIPAMANAHSHAFQRLLRGAVEGTGRGDFWSWRDAMYRAAAGLDPDRMRTIASQTCREMVAAGYGVVGEFHYVHHQPDGRPYGEPNAMAIAVAEAAGEAGLPIVLLPAAYARAGWDGRSLPPEPGQRRFCDPGVEDFLERVDALRAWADGRSGVRVGVAAHSARAVPAEWLEAIAAYSERHGLVRHVHAAEQRREVGEVRAEHGCTPIELLSRTGFLGPRASVVHAIHVDERDVELLAASGSTVIACPTTEGNLGDGHFPAMALHRAGVPIAIGSDSQVRIDPFEEARELETGARRQAESRTALLATVGGDLWSVLSASGYRSLGLDPSAPRMIEVDLDHPNLSGCPPEAIRAALVTSASAAVVAQHGGTVG